MTLLSNKNATETTTAEIAIPLKDLKIFGDFLKCHQFSCCIAIDVFLHLQWQWSGFFDSGNVGTLAFLTCSSLSKQSRLTNLQALYP